jgi:orotate phosphoribosyltransferase
VTDGSHELLDLVPARRGHFVYESGHHGDLWLDLDTLFVHPRRLQPYVAELAGQLTRHGLEAVCGPLVGGAFVAQAVAVELDVAFCYSTAGSYALAPAFEPVIAGRRVAIVDDAINAGSAVSGTAAAVRALGGHLTVVGTLLLLGSTPDVGAPVEHLAALPSALWTVADCPLCDAGAALERPPS